MLNYMVVRQEAHTSLSADFTADVTAGQAVKVVADKTIAPAASGDVIVGVVHHTRTVAEKPLKGDKVSFRLKGDVIPVKTSGGAIAAGAKLSAGDAGTFKTQGVDEVLAGIAWTGGADGADILAIVL